MRENKISIVTVCYNAESVIEETIISVLSQSYSNMEYIIIDGLSQDNTMEIINKYQNQIDICINEPDNGIYDAMNKAIKLATGEWCLFMNAGDIFFNKDVLKTMMNDSDVTSEYDIIYGDTIEIIRGKRMRIKPHGNEIMPFFHQAVLTKTTLLKKYGFDVSYKICADFDFYHRISKINVKKKYCNTPICIFDSTGVSSTNLISVYKERCRSLRINKGFKYRCILINKYFKEFLKKCLPNKLLSIYYDNKSQEYLVPIE